MGKNLKNSNAASEDYFKGGGEMGERIRAFDWTQTPLGAISEWSQSLKISLDICLNSRFPMVIWWGRELVLLYNDGWRPILGANKDRIALGNRGEDVWAEVWDVLKPMFDQVLDTGKATWTDDGLLLVNRYGFTEEAYFTWSYSPIRDDDGKVGGVFTAVTETTRRVVGERRLKTLRELSERTSEEAKTTEDALRAAAATLAENPFDFSFVLIYLLDEGGKKAHLCQSVVVEAETFDETIEIGSEADILNFNCVLETSKSEIIENTKEKFGRLPAGAWADDTTKQMVVVPLAKAGVQNAPAGFLVAGISPRLQFDEEYRGFMELVGGHIAAAISNTRALEEERKRAEALTELDRAKTEFFSNVSHEFRTPLTLMLGNLEEVLQKSGEKIPAEEKQQIKTAHRNSLRLLKLVNTLLDFSRFEANRQQAEFEPTDLSRLTAGLASNFRSSVEKAGIKLTVDCPPLSGEISVDREMWEKIVLNLVSNAFKFTFGGKIEIRLRENENSAVLQVSDTGTGISESDLPRIFERFHRVRGAKSRTHEGTGIGLALVKELVKMHDGAIVAESEIGKGTTFTVSIPKDGRREEEKGGRRKETSDTLENFEKSQNVWQSYLADVMIEADTESIPASPLLPFYTSAKILLAEDNADMREYVRRLLEQNGYEVLAAADGESALESLEQTNFDLILADVMMPLMGGFELLEKVRQHKQTREIPVILLSARAGEESKVEGLEAGADDYLIKPFAARELLARVESNLKLSRLRRESAEELRRAQARLESALEAGLAGTFYWDITNDRVIPDKNMMAYFSLSEQSSTEGVPLAEVLPAIYEEDRLSVEKALNDALEKTGVYQIEYRVNHSDGSIRWLSARGTVERDTEGNTVGMPGFAVDITRLKQAEGILERYRLLSEKARDIIWLLRPDGQIVEVNQAAIDIYGYSREELLQMNIRDLRETSTLGLIDEQLKKAGEGGLHFETVHIRKDGTAFPIEVNATVGDFGGERLLLSIVRDITGRKRVEEALQKSEAAFRQLANAVPQIVWVAGADGKIEYVNDQWLEFSGLSLEETAGAEILAGVFHPDDRKAVFAKWTQAFKSGATYEFEARMRKHTTGEYCWFLMRSEPSRDAGGNILKWFGTSTDITERKRVEETLRESEERMRLAMDAAEMYSWEIDIETRAIIVSENAAQVVGFPRSAKYVNFQQAVMNLVHPDDREKTAEALEGAMKTGEYHRQLRIVRPETGQIIWVEAQGTALRDESGKPVKLLGITQNISRRKLAEEALRESEERFRLLTENAADYAIIFLDNKARITGWNVGAERILGYAESEIIGESGEIIFTPEDRAAQVPEKELATAAAKGSAKNERWHIRKDGSRFFAFGEMIALYDEAGNLRGFAKLFRDLTERRRSELDQKFLFEIAETIRRAENAEDLLFDVLQAVGQHLRVSRSLFMEIDLERDAATIHRDFYAEDTRSFEGDIPLSQFSPDSIKIMRGGQTLVNDDIRNNPRTAGYYETGYKPLGMDAFIGIPLLRNGLWIAGLAVVQDKPRHWHESEISLLETVAERTWLAVEKLRINAALRESEESYRIVAETASDAIFTIDENSAILFANHAAENIFGYKVEEMIGRQLTMLMPENMRAKHRSGMRRYLTTRRRNLDWESVEVPGLRCDGIEIALEISFGEYTRQGVQVFVGVARDITERKAIEAERERLLRSEREARIIAEEASRLKDEFLATVSHELRTPLNAMLGWAAMVRQSKYDVETMRRAFEVVERNARNQNQIISDILDVSRIITGKLNLNLQPVELSPIIYAAVDTVRPAIDAKRISLETRLEPDIETVTGDGDRLQQIIWNLLSNAVKFTPEDGEIEIALRYRSENAEITVTDNGSGIEPGFLPFAFDRFSQADGKTTRKHGGLGLGLAIVRHLVELHGGGVSVRSGGTGQGSTFTVRLPLKTRRINSGAGDADVSETDSAMFSESESVPSRLLDGLKILVVDDEQDALELVAFILTDQGAEVFTADSVDEALEIFERENLDVVISDIGMPEKDGYELIREIKEREAGQNRRIPTLALTAYARKEDNRRALESGFEAYLPKPVEPTLLVEKIIELIS